MTITDFTSEPIAWLYQDALYHPSCIVGRLAPPTMAAYCMTTDDPESMQLHKAHAALGLPDDYSDCAFAGDDSTWPTNFPSSSIDDDDSCAYCGELVDPV